MSPETLNNLKEQKPVDVAEEIQELVQNVQHGIPSSYNLQLLQPVSQLTRFFDVVLSALALVLLSPLMLVIAIAIKIESRGPVFYSQMRVGINRRRKHEAELDERQYLPASQPVRVRETNLFGKPFPVYKFRSMKCNSESDGKAVWCKKGDPRVTRVGCFLRKTHLDELPQIINILKGDMSLVGPRPERPEIITDLKKVIPGYLDRLLVKPGVTGLAQTRHRADVEIFDVRRKIKYDHFYLRKQAFWVNFRIILDTVPMSIGISAEKFKRMRQDNLFFRYFWRTFNYKNFRRFTRRSTAALWSMIW